jgi:hypothetical protein
MLKLFLCAVLCACVHGDRPDEFQHASGGRHHVKEVAVAITITKDPVTDPNDANQNGDGFLDGAAILAYSVNRTQSEFPITMVALVGPKTTKSRPKLVKLGYCKPASLYASHKCHSPTTASPVDRYRVIEYEFPLASKDIKSDYLRPIIDKVLLASTASRATATRSVAPTRSPTINADPPPPLPPVPSPRVRFRRPVRLLRDGRVPEGTSDARTRVTHGATRRD